MEKTDLDQGEKLKGFILSQIEENGPIPFSQFMEWCLYHPEHGYYNSGRSRIGKNGDFFTGTSVHPLFGHLIGKQLSQMAEILGEGAFDLCEMGGGSGYLCKDILDWAKKKSPSFYSSLRVHLIERSPSFLRVQKKRLSEYEGEGKVFWIDPEVFRKGKVEIQGCIISNELFDAFPVHRVILDCGALKEAYVTQQNGQFEELWGKLSDPGIIEYFKSLDITLQDGQKAEVPLQALDWMTKVGRALKRGFVLTIDYGHLSHELYAPHRQEGTFLCYHQHRASENPYERPGEQDITSHVNFSSLIRKGEEVGLRLTGLVPQYRFLIASGLIQEMESLIREMSELESLKLRLTLKHLIEPEVGMGQTFKVLIQHKGVENPQLDGLRDLHNCG